MISSYQLTRVRPMRRPVGPVCRHDGRRSDPPHTSHSLHDVMRTRRRCLGHRLSRPVPAAHAPAGGRKSRAFQSPLSALGLESSARAGVPPGRAAVASLCLNLSVSESNLKAATVTSVSAANLGHRRRRREVSDLCRMRCSHENRFFGSRWRCRVSAASVPVPSCQGD